MRQMLGYFVLWNILRWALRQAGTLGLSWGVGPLHPAEACPPH